MFPGKNVSQRVLFLILILITGCSEKPPEAGRASAAAFPAVEEKVVLSAALPVQNPVPAPLVEPVPLDRPTVSPVLPTETLFAIPVTGSEPTPAPTETPASVPAVVYVQLPPERWKEWPVLPFVSNEMKQLYLRGLEQGNNPRAFSFLGDCQSQPEEFMGRYDSDPVIVAALADPLKETVSHFAGSFNRYSPTVKDGTTAGALLWDQWNDNKEKKCERGETPLDCELRVHKPSIVFIHVGTHWETRNQKYLTVVIERLLAHGAVPVMVIKADNRELDERVNAMSAALAAQYGLPIWNFWATVQHLPNAGMEKNSRMYLSKEGLEIHRISGLQALDAVWRSLQ